MADERKRAPIVGLQWGRAQMSAEIVFGVVRRIWIFWLQWGRAQMSAEMTWAEKLAGMKDRFNGAALR